MIQSTIDNYRIQDDLRVRHLSDQYVLPMPYRIRWYNNLGNVCSKFKQLSNYQVSVFDVSVLKWPHIDGQNTWMIMILQIKCWWNGLVSLRKIIYLIALISRSFCQYLISYEFSIVVKYLNERLMNLWTKLMHSHICRSFSCCFQQIFSHLMHSKPELFFLLRHNLHVLKLIKYWFYFSLCLPHSYQVMNNFYFLFVYSSLYFDCLLFLFHSAIYSIC